MVRARKGVRERRARAARGGRGKRRPRGGRSPDNCSPERGRRFGGCLGLRPHLRLRQDQRELPHVKPVVIKLGGGALAGGALEDLPGILGSGREIALAHGGGLQLTRMLDALGIPTRFREGLRVTDSETLEIAEMVFAGSDGPTLLVEPIPELGRVGEVRLVEPDLIHALWAGGFVPVVAPLGLGPGGPYNVNAHAAAAALAFGLGAEHLFLL